MKKTNLVGIVLCTYNPDKLLFENQIESLINQSHSNFICLIMDDTSSKKSVQEIKDCISRDNRFTLHRNRNNLKPYFNFEDGIKRMLKNEVDYIALCDQDDEWKSNKIQSQIERLEKNGFSITSCDLEIYTDKGKKVRSNLRVVPRTKNYVDVCAANDFAGASLLMNREFAAQALPFPRGNQSSYHDHWLALLGIRMNTLDLDESVLYKFIQHGKNASGNRISNDWDSFCVNFRTYVTKTNRQEYVENRRFLLREIEKKQFWSNKKDISRWLILRKLIRPQMSGDRRVLLFLFLCYLPKIIND